MTDVDSIISENKKLREYISLVNAELELSQRVSEIKENFANSSGSERIIKPILGRISKLQSEKLELQKELKLN